MVSILLYLLICFFKLRQSVPINTLLYAKFIKPEEVYWPEESHSKVYGEVEITTTNHEHIGKCIVVTMELKNGNLVSNANMYPI